MDSSLALINSSCVCRKRAPFNRLFYCLVAIEFVFMQFVPTTYTSIRIALLGVITVFAIFKCKISLYKNYYPVIFFITGNLLFIIIGLLNNAPGATKLITLDIIYPLIYLLLFFAIKETHCLKGFIKLVYFSTIVLTIFDGLYLIALNFGLSYISAYDFVDLDMHMGESFGVGIFSSYHIESYIFNVPFLIGALIYYRFDKRDFFMGHKTIFLFVLLASILVSFLSSSRALQVVIVLSIVIGIISYARLTKNKALTYLTLILIISSVCVAYIIYATRINTFISEFFSNFISKKSKSVDGSQRYIQLTALINGWLSSPSSFIIGNGTGSFTEDCIRSLEQPWSYELSYVALLFQKGLVGFSIFLIIAIYGIRKLNKYNGYDWITKPVLFGYIGFLTANVTDPIMAKFSYIWIYFLPFLVASLCKTDKRLKKFFHNV